MACCDINLKRAFKLTNYAIDVDWVLS